MYYNGTMVELMERSHWPWTTSLYVCIPVFDLEDDIRIQFSIASWSHSNSLSKCTISSMFGVRWIDRTISLNVDKQEVRFYSCVILLRYSVKPWSQAHFLSQCISTAVMVMRSCWLNRWNDLIGPGRPACTFVFLCLMLIVLFVFNPECGHNLTFICC